MQIITFAKQVDEFLDLLLCKQLNRQQMNHDQMCTANVAPNCKRIEVIAILMFPDHRTIVDAFRSGNFDDQAMYASFWFHRIIATKYPF